MSSISSNYECHETFETIDVFLGFALTIGILISFVPQIIVLVVKKNVEGLSVLSCWFNYANCMCNFMNILYLDWFVFDCCKTMTSWTCFRNLLPIVQMLSPFISTLVIFILYTIYRPRLPPMKEFKRQVANQKQQNINNNNSSVQSTPSNQSPPLSPNESSRMLDEPVLNIQSSLDPLNNSIQVADSLDSSQVNNEIDTTSNSNSNNTNDKNDIKSQSNKNYVQDDSFHMKTGNNTVERFFIKMDWYSKPFFWSSIAFSIIFFIIGLAVAVELGGKAKSLHAYAFALGILASILVFFQWLPQIYTTWISQEIGSLSLVSLCIQAPGSLLVVVFQWDQNWSTWFPYLATGIQAFILVGICVYFIIRDKRKKRLQDKLKLEQEQEQQQQEQQENIEYYQSVDNK